MKSRNFLSSRSNGNLDFLQQNYMTNSSSTGLIGGDGVYLSDSVPYRSPQTPAQSEHPSMIYENCGRFYSPVPRHRKPPANGLCEVASRLKWVNESESLEALMSEIENDLPSVVRVVYDNRDHYNVVSDSTCGLFPRMSPNIPIVILELKRTTFVQCQPVKYTNSRKAQKFSYVGPKLAIPVSYEGWFEVVNEDGQIVKSDDSLKSFIHKNVSALIAREDVQCYMNYGNSVVGTDNHPRNTQKKDLSLRSYILPRGSKIHVINLLNINQGRHKMAVCISEQGETDILIDLEAPERFSPVARLENIAGMHRIKDIVSKFRFPMTVHLSYGNVPFQLLHYNAFLRLQKMYEQTNVLVIPLQKHQPIYHIPLHTNEILFARAADSGAELKLMPAFGRLIHICAKLSEMYDNCIYAPISSQNDDIRASSNNQGLFSSPIHSASISSGRSSNKSSQMPMISSACQVEVKPGFKLERHLRRMADQERQRELAEGSNLPEDEDNLHEEIDRLYEQVRYGPNAFVHHINTSRNRIPSLMRRDLRSSKMLNYFPTRRQTQIISQPIPINRMGDPLAYNATHFASATPHYYHHHPHHYPIRPNMFFSK